jgi:hypothetical protein
MAQLVDSASAVRAATRLEVDIRPVELLKAADALAGQTLAARLLQRSELDER